MGYWLQGIDHGGWGAGWLKGEAINAGQQALLVQRAPPQGDHSVLKGLRTKWGTGNHMVTPGPRNQANMSFPCFKCSNLVLEWKKNVSVTRGKRNDGKVTFYCILMWWKKYLKVCFVPLDYRWVFLSENWEILGPIQKRTDVCQRLTRPNRSHTGESFGTSLVVQWQLLEVSLWWCWGRVEHTQSWAGPTPLALEFWAGQDPGMCACTNLGLHL